MIYTIFIIPLLMLFIGMLLLKMPPKKINFFIGYRTKKSMKNEKNWNFANQYCGKLCIKLGLLILLISILIFLLTYFKLLILTEISISIIMIFQLIILILPIFITEKKLKQVK